MELKDTVDLMLSNDYKDRFVAEFEQVRIRAKKLSAMLMKYDADELDFTPTCPIELLKKQLSAMTEYLELLTERAVIEGIDLKGTSK